MPDEKKPATLLEAVLAVQAQAPKLFKTKTAVVKTSKGGEYKYSFADLQVIVDHVGPMMAEQGLVFQAWPTMDQNGRPALRYRLAHAPSGEKEEDTMPLILPQADMQGVGSALTYSRRYALCSVMNFVADEDDDGQAAKAASPADIARAKARMTQRAQELHTEATSISGWLDEDRFKHYMDATGYTEEGLERFVKWLQDNRPKETADA